MQIATWIKKTAAKGAALNPALIVQIAAGLQVKVNVSAGYCIQSNHGVKFKLLPHSQVGNMLSKGSVYVAAERKERG